MATAEQSYLRTELEQRRERLHEAMHSPAADASFSELLKAVDAALSRLDQGIFGICETCHSSIETERLLTDPLVRFCLDHLTSTEQRALESDLSLAARIQRVLLPKADLAPAGWELCYHYQPANMVSGDYCDLFEMGNGLLFMLGDVSGKGVAASMLMSHLHATFRTLAEAVSRWIAWSRMPIAFSARAHWPDNSRRSSWGEPRATARWSLSARGTSRCCTSIATVRLPRSPRECLWECFTTSTSRSIACNLRMVTACSCIPTA